MPGKGGAFHSAYLTLLIPEKKLILVYAKKKTSNLPNLERGDAAKFVEKSRELGKQYWQDTVKEDRIKDKFIHHTGPVG